MKNNEAKQKDEAKPANEGIEEKKCVDETEDKFKNDSVQNNKTKNSSITERYPILQKFITEKEKEKSIRYNSFYKDLFSHVFQGKTHFDLNNIAYTSIQMKDNIFFIKNAIKKTHPFKIIFSSFIAPWISISDVFFSENSFEKIPHKMKKASFVNHKMGEIHNYTKLYITELTRVKTVKYSLSSSTLINNIFITDQIYNKLANNNFVCLFTVKTLSDIQIIKFTDLKILKMNFKDAVELFAYEQISQNIGSPLFYVYKSKNTKIHIQCTSTFNNASKEKRLYSNPDEPANIKFFLSDSELLFADKKGKKLNYLNWLNSIQLDDGNYISRNMEIYKYTDEGYIFAVEGFVFESIRELK